MVFAIGHEASLRVWIYRLSALPVKLHLLIVKVIISNTVARSLKEIFEMVVRLDDALLLIKEFLKLRML